MKRTVAIILSLVLLFSTNAYAMDLGDLFGGLTSLFSSKDEVTYGVGEVVEHDGISIKLINVMQSKGNSYYKPTKGKEFLIFEFSVVNRSKEDLALSTMLCFSMWCDDVNYTISLDALATAMLSGKYQLDRVVEPGDSVTGVVGYEVPSDWKEAKVQYTKEAVLGKTITFVVKR